MRWGIKRLSVLPTLGLWAASLTATEGPQKILTQFREPVMLNRAEVYRDGGTRMIQLVDASSKTLTFCLDGRMKSWNPWKPWRKPPPPQLFFGSHPSSSEAKSIAIGSFEEKRILELLEAWKAAGSPMVSPKSSSPSISMEQIIEHSRRNANFVVQTLEQRAESTSRNKSEHK